MARLKAHHGPTPAYAIQDPDEVAAQTYEVEELLAHAIHESKRSYLVRWVGYTEEDDGWEPEEHIDPGTVKRYWQKLRALGADVPSGAPPP
ncbi:hypothetical protein SJAG_06641 [Schizosaccharomyces japonicus yFS275]|uniref:Chromo domain-containing protein n=1 Tax=Schizosaccharomyces japonicus (strain yFS275 / FY16936) TaxID=402676 RepID=T0TAX6_SCHJY|nr:hypothetical protein SJAG_06641 [Schizosaccharomyces japonicus yFS275]EQC52958.1 hypothetical protein SJAG_06641 [Schizosaccharomyces japonicus yFS275]